MKQLLIAMMATAGIGAIAVQNAGAIELEAMLKAIEAGKLECSNPNHDAKTCSGITRYEVTGEGRFLQIGSTAVQGNPLIVMHANSEVVYQDGKLCGALLQKDLDAAKVEVDGNPAPAQIDQALRDGLKQMVGMNICQLTVQNGEDWIAQGFINGQRQEQLDMPTAWIDANAGYKLAK